MQTEGQPAEQHISDAKGKKRNQKTTWCKKEKIEKEEEEENKKRHDIKASTERGNTEMRSMQRYHQNKRREKEKEKETTRIR